MKHIPNILSALRIIGAFCLLLCSPASVAFWVIYGLCGISDMLDGTLARKLHAESKAGAVLDSVADICFVACCAIKLIPVLQIPTWLWIWAGVIVLIKLANQISALVLCKRFCFPHTLANKLTGLLVFLSVPMTCRSVVPIAIVAGVATFAAIQEGHLIRTRKYVPVQRAERHYKGDGRHNSKLRVSRGSVIRRSSQMEVRSFEKSKRGAAGSS